MSSSQCGLVTVASAIVSLDKETQFQKHQATCSLGHRQYLCWGVGNISIGVHYPKCHDLLFGQNQAISNLQNGQSTWTTWESENNQFDCQQQQSTVGAHQAVLGSPLRLLWPHRGHCLSTISIHLVRWFIMNHLKQSGHYVLSLFFSFFF